MSQGKTIINRLNGSSELPAQPVRLLSTGATRAAGILGDAWVIHRLDRIVSAGLLVRHGEPQRHPEYRLTECGLDLWSSFIAMWQWESHWGTGVVQGALEHDRPRNRLIHLSCGEAIDPIFACSHCKSAVIPFDTVGRYESFIFQDVTRSAGRKRARKVRSDARGELPTLLRVYGDRWNSLLMGAAFQGIKTFSEFELATGISPGPLSDRLEELLSLGLLRSQAYAGVRREYRLTKASIAMFPITVELIHWGNRWLWEGKPPMYVEHNSCGNRLETQWLCSHCNQALKRTTVRFSA